MSNPPRCTDCTARIEFFGSPATGKPCAFDPTPVDARTYPGGRAYPVQSGRAWRFVELVAVIQVQRETSQAEAEDEVRDMDWFVIHECYSNPERTRP